MKCALWYWRHGVLFFEECDSEEEAAELAARWSDQGEASIVGVQREDGTLARRDDWPLLNDAEAAIDAEYERWEAERVAAPRPATRRVADPFGSHADVVARASTPAWIGRQS